MNDRDKDQYDKPFQITGSYDLNSDGKLDTIVLNLCFRSIDQESKIQINNAILATTFNKPENAYLLDLDKEDDFIEILVSDDGPSGDPAYFFFRYDGTEIIDLGFVPTSEGNSISFDGHGRIISWFNFNNCISPKIITGLYELNDNKFIYVELDISDTLNKEYVVQNNMDGYFIEMGDVPSNFYPSWDSETMDKNKLSLSAKDTIIIKEILGYGRYYVQLSNGKLGVLYFWIGD